LRDNGINQPKHLRDAAQNDRHASGPHLDTAAKKRPGPGASDLGTRASICRRCISTSAQRAFSLTINSMK